MHCTCVNRPRLLAYCPALDLSPFPLSLVLPLGVLLVQLVELCSGLRDSHFASCEEELRDQHRSVASCQRSVEVDFEADQVGTHQLKDSWREESGQRSKAPRTSSRVFLLLAMAFATLEFWPVPW